MPGRISQQNLEPHPSGKRDGAGVSKEAVAVIEAPKHATYPVFSAEVAAQWGASTLVAPNFLGNGEPNHCLVPNEKLLVTSSPYQVLKNEAEAPVTGRTKLPMCPSRHLESEPHSPCCECYLACLTALARAWSQDTFPAWTAIHGASVPPSQTPPIRR